MALNDDVTDRCFCVNWFLVVDLSIYRVYFEQQSIPPSTVPLGFVHTMVFVWRPSDPSEKCIEFDHGILPEHLEMFGPSKFEELTCLYPWMRPFYFEYVLYCAFLQYKSHNRYMYSHSTASKSIIVHPPFFTP